MSGPSVLSEVAGPLKQTAAEIAAGVTPVNYGYAPGYVDRYGTNTTPGVTDMTVAFQAAINQARRGGTDVVWGPTGIYCLATGALDCTLLQGSGESIKGLTFRQIDGNHVNLNTGPGNLACGLFVTHNDYTVFDLTGQLSYTFYDASIVTGPSGSISPPAGTYPQTCFLLAREQTAKTGSFARFINTKVQGNFSVAILYNYGAEDGVYFANAWFNFAADVGAVCVCITGNNYFKGANAKMSSRFVTMLTGATSCIHHHFLGGDYAIGFTGSNGTASATSDVFYLDAANWVILDGLWWDNNGVNGIGGRSYLWVDTVHGGTNNLQIQNTWTENNFQQPVYWVAASGGAAAMAIWNLANNYINTQSYTLTNGGSNISLAQVYYTNNTEHATHGIFWLGTLEDSVLMSPTLINIGTSLRNFIFDFNSNLTIGTNTNTLIMDQGSGGILAKGGLAMYGNSIPSQNTGWGSPVGAAVINNYNITDAGGANSNTNKAVAQIIAQLKLLGLFGA
jgi:hypothetical protein